ncbi:hypothetical protein F5Y15DRAFT_363703 [Xylariaceae sp. FL0016]|nr:hypothetical protein F5Y15DRAFT_363703 [Xylariaceae sp. FL0016]
MDSRKEGWSGSAANGNAAAPAQFASLSTHMYDRLRLLNFPLEIQQLVRAQIQTYNPRGGIQDERPYGPSHEFKLRGYPWRAHAEDSVTSRRLMNRLLAVLFDAGWTLQVSADVSRKQRDTDTLLFRKQLASPQQCDWLCIAFSRGDRLRLIDAPADLISAFAGMLRGRWLQEDKGVCYSGAHEFKLNGYPWAATGMDTMHARVLVLDMLGVMDAHGWTVYASVDQKAQPGGDNPTGDTDTWHCRRVKGWQPGLPAYNLG